MEIRAAGAAGYGTKTTYENRRYSRNGQNLEKGDAKSNWAVRNIIVPHIRLLLEVCLRGKQEDDLWLTLCHTHPHPLPPHTHVILRNCHRRGRQRSGSVALPVGDAGEVLGCRSPEPFHLQPV